MIATKRDLFTDCRSRHQEQCPKGRARQDYAVKLSRRESIQGFTFEPPTK